MSNFTNRIAACAILFGVATLSDAQAQWSIDSLSSSRQTIAAVSVGGKAFFAGGRNGGAISDVVDIYDEASGTWTQDALSLPRTNLAATAVGQYALFAGGSPDKATSTAVVDILDTKTMLWSKIMLSQARNGVAATTVGDIAIFAGGNSGGLFVPIASNVVDIYDSSLGAPDNSAAWSTTTLSTARGGIAAATAGDHALFAGGINTAGLVQSTVDIYNGLTGLWSTTSLSQARATRGVSAGTRACFAGGGIASSPFVLSNVVDIYDSQTGTWTSTTLSAARNGLSAVALGDTILLAGGSELSGTTPFVTSVVEVLDVEIVTFGPPMQLSMARTDLAGTIVGDKAIFAGGNDGAGAVARVDLYQPTWFDLGAGKSGLNGIPQLSATGTLVGGTLTTLDLSSAPALTQAHLVIGFSQLNAPFYDGLLVPNPDFLLIGLPTDGSGELTIGAPWPTGLPPGFQVYFQYLVTDTAATFGLSHSNALQGTAP